MGLFDKLFVSEKTNSSNLRKEIIKEAIKIKKANDIEAHKNSNDGLKTSHVQNNDENTRREFVISDSDGFVLADNDTIESEDSYDEYFIEAGRLIFEKKRAAIGMIQRRFSIGFNRASKIMNQLVEAGVVGPENGTHPREILMTLEEFEKYLVENPTSKKIQKKTNKDSSGEKIEKTEDICASTERQYKDPNTFATELLRTKFNKPSDFSVDNVLILEEQGNTLVPKCDYDSVLDFMEILLGRCSWVDLHLLLIDTDGIFNLYNGFPNLLHPVVTDSEKVSVMINWLIKEIEDRQRLFISEGVRDYITYSKKPNKTVDHSIPAIILIIREMQAIINDDQLLDSLEFILRNGPRNRVFVLGFTAYDLRYIKLGKIKTFFHIANDQQMLHIFDTTFKTEEGIDFEKVDGMSGVDFETFCTSILKKRGFTQISTTKVSGDYGGDIVATKDQIKYVIQCKRYSSSIGVSAVQEVIAARSIYKCHVGVVLTNNYFTPAALKLAESNNILLWNRDDLLAMIQS